MFSVDHYMESGFGRFVDSIFADVEFANVHPIKFVRWVMQHTALICTFEGDRRFRLRLSNFPHPVTADQAATLFTEQCAIIESNGVEVLWQDDDAVKRQLFVMN